MYNLVYLVHDLWRSLEGTIRLWLKELGVFSCYIIILLLLYILRNNHETTTLPSRYDYYWLHKRILERFPLRRISHAIFSMKREKFFNARQKKLGTGERFYGMGCLLEISMTLFLEDLFLFSSALKFYKF